MDPMLGEIKLFAGNFAPRHWKFCNGELLSIAQNQALFSIVGSFYGGDGRTSFALPNLMGRSAIGSGYGEGLTPTEIGESGGKESITISKSQMPTHNHDAKFEGLNPIKPKNFEIDVKANVTVNAQSGQGNSNSASANYWATATEKGGGRTSVDIDNGYSSISDVQMASDAVSVKLNTTFVAGTTGGGITDGKVTVEDEGGGEKIDIRTPSLTLNYIICINGEYPSRN